MNFYKSLLLCAFAMTATSVAYAQTSKEEMFADINKTAGVYITYPTPEKSVITQAPKGYVPFYISHYGRHGSRYLISGNDYRWVLAEFVKADRHDALSQLGKDVKHRLELVCAEAGMTEGDLSALGRLQHRGIAERMYNAYPQVFANRDSVSARSTIVPRCAMSMAAFGDRLKELHPTTTICYQMSEQYMRYLNNHSDESNRFSSSKNGPWAEEYRKFKAEHTNADRLVGSLFSDPDYIRKHVNPSDIMWGLYWIAIDMQNIDTPVTFYDIFEKQELFDLWQCFNYQMYVKCANHPLSHGLITDNAKNLLRNIIEGADEALTNEHLAATLRFGHDSSIMPLAALMQIENFGVSVADPAELYKHWTDFKVSPMGANLQMIFFNKKKGTADDVIVKILYNEQEVHIPVATDNFPFYKWTDVKRYLTSRL